MAESFQFGFGNPTGYSDWAKYAGLDRTTGGFAPPPTAQSSVGIEPPTSINEYAQQAIAPVTSAFKNYSNAASQIGQGNVMGAVNAAKGLTKNNGSLSSPSTGNDYQYEQQIGS